MFFDFRPQHFHSCHPSMLASPPHTAPWCLIILFDRHASYLLMSSGETTPPAKTTGLKQLLSIAALDCQEPRGPRLLMPEPGTIAPELQPAVPQKRLTHIYTRTHACELAYRKHVMYRCIDECTYRLRRRLHTSSFLNEHSHVATRDAPCHTCSPRSSDTSSAVCARR